MLTPDPDLERLEKLDPYEVQLRQERAMLLETAGWNAADTFARPRSGNSNCHVHYQHDVAGYPTKVIGGVMLLPRIPDQDRLYLQKYPDIPDDSSMLNFSVGVQPSDRAAHTSECTEFAWLNMLPLAGNRFRLFTYGFQGGEPSSERAHQYLAELLGGIDSFMVRVATLLKRPSTVVDTSESLPYVEALKRAGFSLVSRGTHAQMMGDQGGMVMKKEFPPLRRDMWKEYDIRNTSPR